MDLPDNYPAWTKSPEQVAKDLNVDVSVGLSADEARRRVTKYGYNELKKQPPTPLWKLVLEQFDDMLVKILLLAAFVSFVLAYFDSDAHEEGLRAYIEPFVIVLILVLNAFVGVWQESNAEAALEALKELQSDTAMVIRDGKLVSDLPARELVPGDVVELVVGARVPADIRVVKLKTATLRAEQSSLTGEPVAVLKQLEPVADKDRDCELQLKECMLFSSTAIANGSCTGIVITTGMQTEIGKIQEQIQQASEEEEDTPLKKKLDQFGELLAQVIAWICVVVWLINWRQYLSFDVKPGTIIPDWSTVVFSLKNCIYYFKIAVALAVAAIPEGLPAVITTCLALGTRKMAKKNAIVRKLPSVETLGCTTVICSDKTGTLTTNQMSAVHLVTMASATSLRELVVGGHTYNPTEGAVQGIAKLDKSLEAVAEVCAVCNEAGIEYKAGAFKAIGAPTEAALKVLAEKLGVPDESQAAQLRAARKDNPEKHAEAFSAVYCNRLQKLAVLEFDRNRKSSSVVCAGAAGSKNVLLAKGAAECIVARCDRVLTPDGSVVPMSKEARAVIMSSIESASSRALRCLALARKTELDILADYNGSSHRGHAMLADPSKYEAIESGMVFVGLIGLLDPPRPEVPDAIKDCKKAGIRVIVITGDNQNTAEAICRSIGVFSSDESLKGKSFIGRQFVELPREQQKAALAAKTPMVFARAEPKHKQDIVRLLKEMDEVVAMTGDGVNDAPALKLADIGIAMGIAGTEVAKEASDMVLADDNFSTIVAAVSEGRSIYNNMKAFIRYMISSNIGEVASIFFTAALGLPENLIPVQLLWVNLVTDGPPATALGFNPPDLDIMKKPPRRSDDNLITPWVFFRYMVIGCYVGFATVGAFASWYLFDNVLGLDLSQDGHSTVTWWQLTNWQQCRSWPDFKANSYTAGGKTISFDHPCDIFTVGKAKASTLALTVIVAIEMFNALNALSEDNSLLQMPPWCNPWLLVAMVLSVAFHCVILYIPILADIFSIVPLSLNEWLLVIGFSLPVILIDEVLKLVGRTFFGFHSSSRQQKLKNE